MTRRQLHHAAPGATSTPTLVGRRWCRPLAALLAGALVTGGCAFRHEPIAAGEGWHPVALPGKVRTRYSQERKDGREAVVARSERSASLLRKRLRVPADRLGEVSFSWWVDDLVAGASVADIDREDAPARVLFAFAGDERRLPARTRLLFDLAEALSGERPPYATLMYVWDANAPVGTVIVNPRSDRVRKIVVDSGPMKLKRWRDHRRDLAADFRRAFGEDPGPLDSIAVMSDSDNTRSSALAWYGDVTLH
ncbi:MAG: DUF3047 domain-containing protein [Rubrivivax sp.]|nr:DUF3047 domain-containing protein [Rubrivivax sp.]